MPLSSVQNQFYSIIVQKNKLMLSGTRIRMVKLMLILNQNYIRGINLCYRVATQENEKESQGNSWRLAPYTMKLVYFFSIISQILIHGHNFIFEPLRPNDILLPSILFPPLYSKSFSPPPKRLKTKSSSYEIIGSRQNG